MVHLSTSRDTVGLHTRTVQDAQTLDALLTGAPTRPPSPDGVQGLRLGVLRSRFLDLDPAVERAGRAALDALDEAGAELVDVDVPDDLVLSGGPGIELVLYEAGPLLLSRARARTGRSASRQVGTLADLAARVASSDVRGLVQLMADAPLSPVAYEQARAARWQLRQAYADAFARSGADAFVGPTCPVLPPPVGQDDTVQLRGRDVPLFPTLTRNVAPGSVAGLPMLSLPLGAAEGLPVGLCLEGRPFDDDRLLQVGAAVHGQG